MRLPPFEALLFSGSLLTLVVQAENNFFLLKCLYLVQSVPFPGVTAQHTAFPSPSLQLHGKKATYEFFSRLLVGRQSQFSRKARAEGSRSHYAGEEVQYLSEISLQPTPNADATGCGQSSEPRTPLACLVDTMFSSKECLSKKQNMFDLGLGQLSQEASREEVRGSAPERKCAHQVRVWALEPDAYV